MKASKQKISLTNQNIGETTGNQRQLFLKEYYRSQTQLKTTQQIGFPNLKQNTQSFFGEESTPTSANGINLSHMRQSQTKQVKYIY